MGTYRILKKIAAGGMAEVFLGKVVGVGGFEKPVAVKRILPSYVENENFVGLFLREAKLSVALQHANVVQVLDLGTSRGQYYMVMEFVDGETVRALLKAAKARALTLGLRECCFIAQQVAAGLTYAHERTDRAGAPLNIIHRDINPSNVMLARNGEVKLADFGIAKAADDNQETVAGVIKGKVNYLSPEQVKGGQVDQRSDIFLLGLLLHEMLSGKLLFQGAHAQAFFEIASFDEKKLEPLPGVPLPLWAIIQRALAANPAERFQNARDFSDALQTFLFDNRLKVGPNDIAALFTRAFPERRSPLESVDDHGEEIRIDLGEPGAEKEPAPVEGAPAAAPAAPRRTSTASMPAIVAPAPAPTSPKSSESSPSTPRTPPGTPPPAAQRTPGPGAPQAAPPTPAEPVRQVVTTSSPLIASRPQATREPSPAATPAPGTAPAPGSAAGQRRPQKRRLGDILVGRGYITQHQLDEAIGRQKRVGKRLGDLLVEEALVDPENLLRALSEQAGVPYITDEKLQSMPVPEELLKLVPLEMAERLCAVPVAMKNRELYCAVVEPRDQRVHSALKFASRALEVRSLFATELAIRRAIKRFYLGKDLRMELELDILQQSGSKARTQHFVEKVPGQSFINFDEIARRTAAPESPALELVSIAESIFPGAAPARPLPAVAPVAAPAPAAPAPVAAPTPAPALPLITAALPVAAPVAAPSPAPVAAPAPRPTLVQAPARASTLRARMVLVISDASEARDAIVLVLSRQGVAAAGASTGQCVEALGRGGFDLAVIAEDSVEAPNTLASQLRAAYPNTEILVLSSFGAALLGEGGPASRLSGQYARLLEGAFGVLGGAASVGPGLARLARRLGKRLGVSALEEERIAAAAYALALAARLEEQPRFELPTLSSLKGILGNDFADLAHLLTPVMQEGPLVEGMAGRAAGALLCAALFMAESQSTAPSSAEAARALGALRQEARVTTSALEALAAEISGTGPGAGSGPRVVIAESDNASALTLQIRLVAEGLSLVRAETGAEALSAVREGASALILASRLRDGEALPVVTTLREDDATARLPIFMLAPAEDAALVGTGLEAGADDVLLRPLNLDILAAKLRRALGQRPGARKTAG